MGFRKIDPERWEFANEGFLRGQKHFLKNIRRRKGSSQPFPSQQALGACVEVEWFGFNGELDRLRRDRQVLMTELLKLRQQHQKTRAYLQAMEQRLQGTEQKQQQMMAFLAKAMQNPAFIQQLVQQKEKRKELEDNVRKKRRRPIEQGPSSVGGIESSRSGGRINPIKIEDLEFGDIEVSDLEALALEMQGFGKARKEQDEDLEQLEGVDKELDEGFLEELLNERFEEELDIPSTEEGEDGYMTSLANRLGYLGSSPK